MRGLSIQICPCPWHPGPPVGTSCPLGPVGFSWRKAQRKPGWKAWVLTTPIPSPWVSGAGRSLHGSLAPGHRPSWLPDTLTRGPCQPRSWLLGVLSLPGWHAGAPLSLGNPLCQPPFLLGGFPVTLMRCWSRAGWSQPETAGSTPGPKPTAPCSEGTCSWAFALTSQPVPASRRDPSKTYPWKAVT